MAAQQQDQQGVSPFPTPPSVFYKLYTDERVKSGQAPKPPAPVKGIYTMFGAPFNTEDAMIQSLEDQKIRRLYPTDYDKKVELKKLNRSILVCFLELLDILITNPASPARDQKIQDLSVLFINMHHLINEFRPHQARETLRVIMERQKKQRDDMINQIQKATEKARGILKESSDALTAAASTVSESRRLLVGGEVGGVDDIAIVMTSSAPAAVGVDKKRAKVNSRLRTQQFVEMQDSELCSLIDSLITGTKT